MELQSSELKRPFLKDVTWYDGFITEAQRSEAVIAHTVEISRVCARRQVQREYHAQELLRQIDRFRLK